MQARQLQAYEQLLAIMSDQATEFLHPYYIKLRGTGFTDDQAMKLVCEMQRMLLGETLEVDDEDKDADG